MHQIIVGKYDEGELHSMQEAFDYAKTIEGHVEIFVKPGIYDEKLVLERDDISIVGEDPFTTVVTYDDYARKMHADGKPYGTFRTATLLLHGNDITLKNITVINRAGNGRDIGQAVALHLNGDRIRVENCRMLAAQDTLYVEPQPECSKDHEDDLPDEYNVCVARHYFKDCYIRGDVDFIFGGATAYFENCEIFSQYNITEYDDETKGTTKGYATAACTYRGQRFGFVFEGCRFTGDCPKQTVYLGRPWRMYAKTVLLRCEIGEHIKAEGWHDWDKPKAHVNALYAEYQCVYHGDASLKDRVDWVVRMTDEEAAEYTKAHILWDGLE